MGATPYVIAIMSAWAVVATIIAVLHGRGRGRERRGHAETREKVERHRAALSRMKAQAVARAAELEALQRRHEALQRLAELQRSTEQPRAAGDSDAGATPIPMLTPGGVDVSAEVCALLEHVARAARAMRPYSAFSRGHLGPEPRTARYDLHWLSDCLHGVDQLGHALARGRVDALGSACRELLSMYEQYPVDSTGYDSRAAFHRLRESVPLAPPVDALRAMLGKIAAWQAVQSSAPAPTAAGQ